MYSAAVCIPSNSMRVNVPDLVRLIDDTDVNVADLTPSFIKLISPDDVPKN